MTPILLSALLLTAPPRDIIANNAFFYYDPENYFLEFDTFLDVEGNEKLLERLGARR